MTLSPTSRRSVAVQSCLLAVAAVCLSIGWASVAAAQGPGGHGGPGGMMGGRRMGGIGREPEGTMMRPVVRPSLQLGLGGRWWDDNKTIKRLNLRPDEQRRMDDLFEANKGTLVNLYSNLQREENHLATLPPGDLQDETKVFAAIDRVAQARTDLEKQSVHILLQLRQQMDPAQVQELDREIANAH